jgi:DnaJ-class molecular chaperone
MVKLYTVCQRCKGSKQILGMGGMKAECPDCDGIGYNPKEDLTVPKDAEHYSVEAPKAKVYKGWPKGKPRKTVTST